MVNVHRDKYSKTAKQTAKLVKHYAMKVGGEVGLRLRTFWT